MAHTCPIFGTSAQVLGKTGQHYTMFTKLSTATVIFHKIAYFSHSACTAHSVPPPFFDGPYVASMAELDHQMRGDRGAGSGGGGEGSGNQQHVQGLCSPRHCTTLPSPAVATMSEASRELRLGSKRIHHDTIKPNQIAMIKNCNMSKNTDEHPTLAFMYTLFSRYRPIMIVVGFACVHFQDQPSMVAWGISWQVQGPS